MTYIKDSAVGFMLAIIISDLMDLDMLAVKGEAKMSFAILNSG